MNHCGTLPLETERLILRRFELSDAPAFYQNVCSDPKVNTYLTWKLHESPAETETGSWTSEDGLCTIRQFSTYYDVTLDYENGSPAEVGAAYAKTILQAVPDYETLFEPYLFENISCLFGGREINYEALEKRITTLESSIRDEYKEEIESFARTISAGEEVSI